MRTWGEVLERTTLPAAELADRLPGSPRAVITAPPGSGKTTLVPVMAALETTGRVLVAEPRRIAVRAAARHLASLLGESVGQRVGYSIRGESKRSSGTQIEFVTTGLLVQCMIHDPDLAGVDAVILDEVHERSLDTDLALAFALDIADLRDDLTLWAMSATTDAVALAALMGDGTPVHSARGRMFDVDTSFVAPPARVLALDARGMSRDFLRFLVAHTAETISGIEAGTLLVFVPSVRDVDESVAALRGLTDAPVLPLHGSLPADAQDRAIGPHSGPRIVVTTSVAETGLTVADVVGVIDAGLSRQPRYDAARDASALVTVRASKAAMTQRAGRAGRTQAGFAHRLLAPQEYAALRAADPPESATADLTDAALALAAWGDPDASASRFLDPLPPAALTPARARLVELGAADAGGKLTAVGEQLADLPLDPRTGAALLALAPVIGAERAARIAAALESGRRAPGSDARALPNPGADKRTIDRLTRELRGTAASRPSRRIDNDAALALMVARAHPGFIARARSANSPRYLTASGLGVELPTDSPLIGSPWLAIAEVQRLGQTFLVRSAAPLPEDLLDYAGAHLITSSTQHEIHGATIHATRSRRLGVIDLHTQPIAIDPDAARPLARELIAERGTGIVDAPSPAVAVLLHRLAFVYARRGEPWPDFSAQAIATNPDLLATCLDRLAHGKKARSDDLRADIMAALPWPEAARLDELVPERLEIPSGRSVALSYTDDSIRIAAKLQEFFGAGSSPTVLDQPVVIELLAPGGQTLATTADLASFWAGPYAQVRAEMRGRYPKHPWPEDPSAATPTRLTNRALRERG